MTENVSDEVRSMIERKRAEAAEKRRQILAGRTNTDAPNVPQPQVHIAEDPPAVSTSSMIPPPIQGIGRNQKATRSVAPIIIRSADIRQPYQKVSTNQSKDVKRGLVWIYLFGLRG